MVGFFSIARIQGQNVPLNCALHEEIKYFC